MRKLMSVLTLAVLLVPAVAEAQHSKGKRKTSRTVVVSHSRDECCWGNRFSLEPYAGAMKDAYDASPDDENTGLLVGFKVGYQIGNRSRLLANIGYGQTDNVSNPNGLGSYYVYDNTWVFTTAGAEFDVVPGRTSASVGLQGGVAWRRVDLDGTVGTPLTPALDDDSFASYEVIIPALSVRHNFTHRASLVVGLQDNIFDFLEGSAKHSLALTAGIALR